MTSTRLNVPDLPIPALQWTEDKIHMKAITVHLNIHCPGKFAQNCQVLVLLAPIVIHQDITLNVRMYIHLQITPNNTTISTASTPIFTQTIISLQFSSPFQAVFILPHAYIHNTLHVVQFLQFSRIGSPLQKLITCENLDRALVQWQNMSIHQYKNAKITKIQDPRKFTR